MCVNGCTTQGSSSRLVQENVALMKETMNGLDTSHLGHTNFIIGASLS